MLGRVWIIILVYSMNCYAQEHLLTGVKPLFSIGQDVLGQHQMSACGFVQQLGGLAYNLVEWATALRYGCTESLTAVVVFPVLAEEFSRVKLKGLGNITLAGECCLYKHNQSNSSHQWTGLCSVLLPTTGQHAPIQGHLLIGLNDSLSSFDINLAQPTTSYLIGTTFHHSSISHYASGAGTILLQTNTSKFCYRPTLCCDLAFGHKLNFNNQMQISILLEMNGRFRPSTMVDGKINDHTGSYRLWLGPSLRCCYKGLRLQLGVQYPIVERFFAPRIAPNYRIAFAACIE